MNEHVGVSTGCVKQDSDWCTWHPAGSSCVAPTPCRVRRVN